MTIIYLSNFFNHHQSSLSDRFYEATGGKYYFIETIQLPAEQAELGYPKLDRPYVLSYDTDKILAERLIMEADVVIHGQAPVRLIKKRLAVGKLTFHDNERRYKSIVKYLKWPVYTYNSWFLNKGYLLCASAYASRDFGLSGMDSEKCFKWGYYTKVQDLDIDAILSNCKVATHYISMMWCSRFLNWKHPELPIKLAFILKNKGYRFVIDMYGSGKEYESMKCLAHKLGVDEVVRFHGSCPNDEILKQMCNHEIFLCTSDRYEGWGAVLNEAMASGCAVIASHDIGAVPYLVQDGVNGLIFKSRDIDSLAEKVVWLINNKKQCEDIRRTAFETMQNVWNAEVACRNFITLAESLLNGTPCNIQHGPCSPAPRMNHNWM